MTWSRQRILLGWSRFAPISILLASGLICLLLGGCSERRAQVEKLERQMNSAKKAEPAPTITPEAALPPDTNPDDAADSDEANATNDSDHDDSSVTDENTTDSEGDSAVMAEDQAADTSRRLTLNGQDTNAEFDPDEIPTGIEETRKTKPEDLTGSGGFTLQIASTDSRAYADQLVQEFKDRGYEPYISELSIDGVTRYRVRVGQYANSTEAERAKVLFAEEYGIDGWVDRVR